MGAHNHHINSLQNQVDVLHLGLRAALDAVPTVFGCRAGPGLARASSRISVISRSHGPFPSPIVHIYPYSKHPPVPDLYASLSPRNLPPLARTMPRGFMHCIAPSVVSVFMPPPFFLVIFFGDFFLVIFFLVIFFL